jgi:hypothetical protein
MNDINNNQQHIIFYHGENCIDGAMAYAILHEKLTKEGIKEEDIIAIPLGHSKPEEAIETIRSKIDELPKLTKQDKIDETSQSTDQNNKHKVFFVDYFPNSENTTDLFNELSDNNNIEICVRDHHQTALENITKSTQHKTQIPTNLEKGNRFDSFIKFALDRSATMILWQEIHPEKPAPDFIDIVGKADMNQLISEDEYKIASYLDSIPKFSPTQALEAYQEFKEKTTQEMIELGEPIYNQLVENTNEAIDKIRVFCLESSEKSEPKSTALLEIDKMENIGRIGTKMIKDRFCGITEADFVLVARPANQDIMNVSVIPCRTAKINAGEIAKYMGEKNGGKGGGRSDQAAFQIPTANYEKMLHQAQEVDLSGAEIGESKTISSQSPKCAKSSKSI